MTKSLKTVFLSLVGAFLFCFAQIFIPSLQELFAGSLLFLSPFLLFSLLGLVLLILTYRRKKKDRLKKYLLLTGYSAAGILPAIVLHNLVYAFFILLFGPAFWGPSGKGDEPVFFLLGLVVLPITFLIGVIGSFWSWPKKS